VTDDILLRFVDSGNPADEVHTVHLRGVGETLGTGTIRGPLPESFVFERMLFLRSGFTNRDEGGELCHTYYPAPTRRGVPRSRPGR